MVPGQHLAAFVEADARAVQVHRAVVAALDVVLAAPERAHRCVQAGGAGGLGDRTGLDHIVARTHETPAEAAACRLHMHRHLFGLQTQHTCSGGSVQAGALSADPELGAPVSQLDGAVQRLHGCMGQVGKDELGFQLPRRGGQRRHVGVERARAGLAGQLAVLGQQAFAVHLLDAGGVPLQLERVSPLFGGPVAVGHDGHAFAAAVDRHAQHGLHAFDGARRAVVHRS